jgi:hypothetical protein
LVLAEDPATSVDEGQERIESPTSKLDRSAIDQQFSAVAHDLEPAKFNAYGIFGQPSHGRIVAPRFKTFQNESSCDKDRRGTFS